MSRLTVTKENSVQRNPEWVSELLLDAESWKREGIARGVPKVFREVREKELYITAESK